MSIQDAAGNKPNEIENRDVRVLTQYLTVIPEGGDVYNVVSQSGKSYTVDVRDGACTCPDAQYNLDDDELCKHARRVAFETGDRPIPSWVDSDVLPDDFALHVDATPSVAASHDGDAITQERDDVGGDGRPDGCSCWNTDEDLPCFPCFRDGFESQNPAVDE